MSRPLVLIAAVAGAAALGTYWLFTGDPLPIQAAGLGESNGKMWAALVAIVLLTFLVLRLERGDLF